MVDYETMVKELEIDIGLLNNLTQDVYYYKSMYESEIDIPERKMINEENLQFAYEQYREHTIYLHGELEKWIQRTLEEDRMVRLDYYRALKELRGRKSRGL